jgi:hypothetical protein
VKVVYVDEIREMGMVGWVRHATEVMGSIRFPGTVDKDSVLMRTISKTCVFW